MDCPLYCTADGVADHLFVCSSTVFTMDCPAYFSVDGGGLLILPLINSFHDGLLILPLVNGFYGLRAVLLSEWQWIAHSSACQWLP